MPGVLTGLAAILTAAAGLYIAVRPKQVEPAKVEVPSATAKSRPLQKPTESAMTNSVPRYCGENENCDGMVVGCQASGHRPSEVAQGKWLYGPNSEEFKTNLQGVGLTGGIEYGAWSNSDCQLSGSGWHAKVGTCGKGTPGAAGWQRCVNVKVLPSS